MLTLIDRLKEPSTWAAISAALVAVGASDMFASQVAEIGLYAGALVSAVLGAIMREKGPA